MSTSSVPPKGVPPEVERWRTDVVRRVRSGERFAGVYATGGGDACRLVALLATSSGIDRLDVGLRAKDEVLSYPALTPDVSAATWYERAMHDLSGVLPLGHPHLRPLLLPRDTDTPPPRPGGDQVTEPLTPEERPGPTDVSGRGIFTVPYGPVRSGVFESIEFLVETPGEDIPHINIRPYFKHRGVAKRFESCTLQDAVLVAERVEGIASVAHALAFCHAVERLAAVQVPRYAALLRVVFAELERISNHLDVAMRLADAAGLAVGVARLGWHKELVMRLISGLCGSRFGRGVVVPGGIRPGLSISADELIEAVQVFAKRLRGDVRALMASPSFLDRLRGTGVLDAALARRHGALGPIGRACGFDDDSRRVRPYDGYRLLAPPLTAGIKTCDAVGRLRVRWAEIDSAVMLVLDAVDALHRVDRQPAAAISAPSGSSVGWAEAPQGEVVYGVELADGRVRRCFARSASFHNLVLFRDVWHGDVKTDFAFIEASFGLSYAAVAM